VRYAGYVERLFVSTQGARVREGDLLASISSDEVLRLEGELIQAKKWAGDSMAPLRERLRLLGVSAKDVAEVEASGKVLAALAVKSPATGYVTAIGVTQGDRVDPDRALFEIADLSRVWLVAEVPESQVSRVREGLQATLSIDAYPGETFSGRVEYLSPTLDSETRSLPIRVSLPNPGDRLKPGMFGRVQVALAQKVGVTVDAEAVVDTGEHQLAFVQTRPGHYEPREVTVGERVRDRVQVLSGVREGEVVAARGNFFIDSESRLRASASEGTPALDAGPERSRP
jgi:Cu(I)/Ag(I) efflux system membrane fusion protein